MTLREFALEVVRTLRARSFAALWAGGCVRDQLLGLEPHDFDVATDATPSVVRKLFRRSIAVGAQFGVIEVLGPFPKMHVQVATFRSDGAYVDGRHPARVRFGTPEEDAKRRDFTINGLFLDPLEDRVIDYVGGQEDLRQKRLRAIGNPTERFAEDRLRLLRAVRFFARFDLQFEGETLAALRTMAPQVTDISAERITDELRKMALLPQRGAAYRTLADTGLLAAVLGPWAGAPGAAPAFSVLEALTDPLSLPLALADVLLELHGPRLDEILATQDVERLAQRLRLSNDERDRLAWLVTNRDILRGAEALPYSVLKPLLAHEGIDDLLNWLEARLRTQGTAPRAVEYCRARRQSWDRQALDPPPLLTGDDLVRLGYHPGPAFRLLLGRIREAQLNEQIGSRDEALTLLKRLEKETKKEA
jgi:poly(A) polymerase